MIDLLWNLFLAAIWVAVTGSPTPGNFLLGLVLGLLILQLTRGTLHSRRYLQRMTRVLRLAGFFVVELIRANLQVAYEVITPRHYMCPGIVAVPLEARTDAEITLLAALVSLTPGSTMVEVSEDRRVMYVLHMYIQDADKVRREIKDGFERRILEVLR